MDSFEFLREWESSTELGPNSNSAELVDEVFMRLPSPYAMACPTPLMRRTVPPMPSMSDEPFLRMAS
eukprot:scaffold142218_cov63-Phaeocystis_antarctica.AAC.1